MNHWSTKYLGIPWVSGGRTDQGLDCWGLLCTVFKNERGVEVNPHASMCIEQPFSMRLALQETSGPWTVVDTPEPFDGVAIGRNGSYHHVGIYIGDDSILHTQKNVGSHITPLSRLSQSGLDTVTFYRYDPGFHS
jgi:cell wall-associated NlpC family hydrolase